MNGRLLEVGTHHVLRGCSSAPATTRRNSDKVRPQSDRVQRAHGKEGEEREDLPGERAPTRFIAGGGSLSLEVLLR
jgi:hypothetical protein